MSEQAFSRTCPQCSRLVPRRIPACRCGFSFEAPPTPPTGAGLDPNETAAGRTNLSPLWALPLTAIIVLAGAYVLTNRSMPVTPGTGQATIARASDRAGTEPVSPLRDVLPPTTPAPALEPPPAAVSPPAPALPAPPASLAALVGRVAPAVVTIQAGPGSGSGFFVAQDTIVTNHHVVGRSSSVVVFARGGERLDGRVVDTAPPVDLALVRVGGADRVRPVLEIRPTDTVQVGEEVVAVGSPGFGAHALEASVTRGVVSGVRSLDGVVLLQTDAALNPGNSGGPLLDLSGRVLGITTAKARGSESIGFAVAGDYALALLQGRGTQPVRALLKQASTGTGLERWQSRAPSETDQARGAGVQRLEAHAQSLARPAAQFVAMVEQFRDRCVSELVVGMGARSAAWQDAAAWIDRDAAVSPDCLGFRERIRGLRADIGAALDTAEEDARRAGVYPGEVRDVLRRHGLDWDGWRR